MLCVVFTLGCAKAVDLGWVLRETKKAAPYLVRQDGKNRFPVSTLKSVSDQPLPGRLSPELKSWDGAVSASVT